MCESRPQSRKSQRLASSRAAEPFTGSLDSGGSAKRHSEAASPFAVEESWLGSCTGFHINRVGRPVLVKRDCSTWNKAAPSEEDTAERFLVEHLIGKREACDAISPVPLRRARLNGQRTRHYSEPACG